MFEFRAPRYASADGQAIDMEINHPVRGWIPFTASATDVEEYGVELYEAAKGSAAPFVEPAP